MSSTVTLRGAGTALVTPFRPDGSIDEPCFRRLVARQVEAGIRLLIPCGTTGESATLSFEERERLVKAALAECGSTALVVAGTGSNDTRQAVEQAKRAADWGAHAVLSLAPPYNKPPQDALIDHFSAVAEGAGVPVIVYNVPGRVGVNVEAATILTLAEVPGIAAVKEASGNMTQCMTILREKPEGFTFLSGEDSLTLAFLAMGGDGLISVIGNEAPADITRLVAHGLAGRFAEAREIHERLLPLMDANFCESNPIPVKHAMAVMGLCENVLRRPLRPLAAGRHAVLESTLAVAGLLERSATAAS